MLLAWLSRLLRRPSAAVVEGNVAEVVEEEDIAKDKRWKGAANNNSITSSSSKQLRITSEDSPPPVGRSVKHKPRPGGGGSSRHPKLGCGELTTRQGELLRKKKAPRPSQTPQM